MSQPYPVQPGSKRDEPLAYQMNTITTGNLNEFDTGPVIYQNRQRNRIMREMYYPKFHTIMGIIVLLLSIVMIAVEIAGSRAMEPYVNSFPSLSGPKIVDPFLYWSGTWVGAFTFIIGVTQLIAEIKVNRCFLIAALILEGVSYCFLPTGLSLASIELASYPEYFGFSEKDKAEISKQYPTYEATINLNIAKAAVVVTFILILGILFLIHIIVSCYELCCRTLRE